LEVRTGLELLRASRRRTQLGSAFDQLLGDDLGGRVLAFARRATLATRNVRHFEPLGVTIVDPWDES
jgi:hypothetical protein